MDERQATVRVCPACGYRNGEGVKYCSRCGCYVSPLFIERPMIIRQSFRKSKVMCIVNGVPIPMEDYFALAEFFNDAGIEFEMEGVVLK